MKYYIIAGEASGDLHGSNLMRGLYAEDPEADIRFWGGGMMDSVHKEHQSGQGLVRDYSEDAVMGFTYALLHPGQLLRKLAFCKADIMAFAPDVVILIDYPGFNFRVARFAHSKGIRTFYYIAPKVWASRERRVRALRRDIDRLFIVFPFERQYFRRKGVGYVYRGNPLVDAIDSSPLLHEERGVFLERNGLPDKKYIAVLAGSRRGEVSYMMPRCVEFARLLRTRPGFEDYHFVVGGAPSRSESDYTVHMEERDREYFHIVFGQTYGVLRHAEAAVVNSGTASLEACLIGTPQVVGYGGSEINFNIALLIIKVESISLGNLILGRKAFKELVQFYLTPENLCNEVIRLVRDQEYREEMLGDFALIRGMLGGGGASRAVAAEMVSELHLPADCPPPPDTLPEAGQVSDEIPV